MSEKCHLCKGKRKFNAGNGVWIPCPGCTSGKAAATIADAVAARPATDGTPTVLRFTVDGEAVGKERARVFSKHLPSGKTITRAVTPEKTREYEAKVKACAQAAVLATRWAWNKSDRFNVVLRIYRTHWDRGADVDNIAKCYLDAGNGCLWIDDRLVRGIGIALQDPDPVRPRVEVEVRRFKTARRAA
jgi:Holliday junction resolvase RusA-like endonuclease